MDSEALAAAAGNHRQAAKRLQRAVNTLDLDGDVAGLMALAAEAATLGERSPGRHWGCRRTAAPFRSEAVSPSTRLAPRRACRAGLRDINSGIALPAQEPLSGLPSRERPKREW
jgi:hypothetical protein